MTGARKPADPPPVPLKQVVGYADRFSVKPGETIRFMVSSQAPYQASIVRLTGRPKRGGPERFEPVHWSGVPPHHRGRIQPVAPGSYGIVQDVPLHESQAFSFQIALCPTTPLKGRQFLMGQWSDDEGRGAALLIDETGCICLLTGDGTRRCELTTGVPVEQRRWILVTASHDSASGIARLHQTSLGEGVMPPLTAQGSSSLAPPQPGTHFTIAAGVRFDTVGRSTSHSHFNGKLQAPLVLGRAIDTAEGEPAHFDSATVATDPDLIAAWDFSLAMESTRFIEVSPNRHHGELVNMPTRAVTGWNWTGKEHCWGHAPEQYGAIHFHDDDLYDAEWSPDFALKIPAEARSGVYAARLETDTETESIPFFICGSPAGQRADLLLLLPTASYLAYANERLATDVGETEALAGHLSILQTEDVWLTQHPEIGLSLYDTHSDGSGVSYSSRLRPILNMRPGRLSAWIGSNPRAPWQFNADLDIVGFLEQAGIPYEVATDEDLHQDGLALLSRYRCVMTGSHPEYHSTAMLDALEAYLGTGGRVMYMGGNGFYWRIAFNDAVPGVIELRRAEDGIRDWVSQPGEYYHSFSAELGGLWRRIGRPPQKLVGVGMAAQGFDYSGHFRLSGDAGNDRADFILNGIAGDIIGNFGSVGGGAAGLELDRADFGLGTPSHALIVASSEGHGNLTFAVPEEVDNVSDALVATRNTSLRGDIVFFETLSGGAVFSVGSIAWAGSLAHHGYDNNVARMTSNVLQRFLDPEAFQYPAS